MGRDVSLVVALVSDGSGPGCVREGEDVTGDPLVEIVIDDDPECPDGWHLELQSASDYCPACGYPFGGDDDASPWPAGVYVAEKET